jgi:TRAP-type C4-dicarboxylate transport system permease small subunit
MLETILDLEKKLIRVETWLLVACVVAMLVLAGYNVAYRNLLVPWQTQLLTSGPPVTATSGEAEEKAESEQEPAGDAAKASEEGDFEGGFGAPSDDDEDETSEEGGFEGGFGAPADEPEADDAPEESDDEEPGFEGGFGAQPDDGGDEADDAPEPDDDGGFEGGFGASDDAESNDDEIGGGFGASGDETSPDETGEKADGDSDELDASAVAEEAGDDIAEPTGGPPPEGSFADTMVGVIDAMKLGWIDVLLRQLVIISGFLGAMIAARRRNHITIDAVGKLLEGRPRHIVDAITSSVSAGVCLVLAVAGWDLVKIGLDFPTELLPFAQEWTFQLAFPIGFGLLALHFAIRVYESIVLAGRDEVVDDGEDDEGGEDTPTTSEAAAGGAV